jgi:CRP-like cAMP-binding protein
MENSSSAAAKETQTISIEPGEFLIREKTACDALYIIKEGQLEVFKMTTEGTKLPMGMVSSGQYVGEAALLLGKSHASNVVALSPVKAVKISKASIEAQLKTVPAWLLALTRGLIDRLHNANDLMKRNGLVDETLSGQLRAVEEKFKK